MSEDVDLRLGGLGVRFNISSIPGEVAPARIVAPPLSSLGLVVVVVVVALVLVLERV